MANFLSSHPGDRLHQGDGQLEAMLSGQPLPESASPENASTELRGVGELLATLRAAPMDRVESAGQARALDAFRTTFAGFNPTRVPPRRPTMISKLRGAKLGAALVVGAVGFGSAGAAAYAGVLPAELQRIAHDTISAPAPEPVDEAEDQNKTDKTDKTDKTAVETDPAEVEKDKSADSTQTGTETNKTAVGPDATGSAAFGLCTAWANVEAKGQVAEKSIAFRNLATAAGGAGGITAYCATVAHPGAPKTDQSATDPTGKSATHPKGKSADHPTSSSSNHPSGKPQG